MQTLRVSTSVRQPLRPTILETRQRHIAISMGRLLARPPRQPTTSVIRRLLTVTAMGTQQARQGRTQTILATPTPPIQTITAAQLVRRLPQPTTLETLPLPIGTNTVRLKAPQHHLPTISAIGTLNSAVITPIPLSGRGST